MSPPLAPARGARSMSTSASIQPGRSREQQERLYQQPPEGPTASFSSSTSSPQLPELPEFSDSIDPLASSPRPLARPGLADRTRSAPAVHQLSSPSLHTASAAPTGTAHGHSSSNSATFVRDAPVSRGSHSSHPAGLASILNTPILSITSDDNKIVEESVGAEENKADVIVSGVDAQTIDDNPRDDIKDGFASDMREVRIAVVGESGVGKTTFVQRALALSQPPRSTITSRRLSLNKVTHQVRCLEIRLNDVEIRNDHSIKWPFEIEGQVFPRVDGALLLYDVTNGQSVAALPNLLNALTKASVPCILVACKCDSPLDSVEVNPTVLEKAASSLGNVESQQTSAGAPESQRRCVGLILKKILAHTNDHYNPPTRPSSKSTAMDSLNDGRSSCADVPGTTPEPDGRTGSNLSLSQTIASRDGSGVENPGRVRSASESSHLRAPMHGRPKHGSSNSVDSTARTHLSMAEETDDNDPGPGSAPSVYQETSTPGASDVGFSFEELVDRLLSQPMSKADAKFAAVFLCLYRKFATPGELLESVIQHFDALNTSGIPRMLRMASQLRYVNVMAQWIEGYPGDFAHPRTQRRMNLFISRLAGSRVFAVAAKEMVAHLETVIEDDDTDWACSDSLRERANTEESLAPSKAPSVRSSSTTLNAPYAVGDELCRCFTGATLEGGKSVRASSSSSVRSGSSRLAPSGVFSDSQSLSASSPIGVARRQAALLSPIPKIPLSKVQWHQFMDTPEIEIAREITRIDYIMFSAIRPRDLVRHVSMSAEQKEKCRGLENVNRMIAQFNHLAGWVASMILLRDKPKHRAKAMERMMDLAWKLRQLNNYNGLGAVIAGLNGMAVYRLAQTRELVSPQAQKNFMRLEILMGTQKSHFAYRLAWENTSSERIPFLPLHRRDLVSAEEGNRTFIGERKDRINWKKFEIMGEVIICVQKSQSAPYTRLVRNEEVQRLVQEAKFPKDDNALYERSVHVEPSNNSGSSLADKKIFSWLHQR
ncbi:ras GEF [Xylona heveae TC161]|uniref:Ras GEF n=1 Tax=Xylona heveae (strain CBS 132557 / TC161) TaxID=1328760 RepID=A0A165A5N2_XYLHT|nr:ras GEF [Xylona heveae TC161]KZF19987.1 ras GEF [Xylona heveae TC161]